MKIKKFKISYCFIALILIIISSYILSFLILQDVSKDKYYLNDFFDILSYSSDGINYNNYSYDMYNNYTGDDIYLNISVMEGYDKSLLLNSINTKVIVNTVPNFFSDKKPIDIPFDKITTNTSDFIFLNLSEYEGENLILHLSKINENSDLSILSLSAIDQNDMQLFIVRHLQFQLFYIGVSLCCILFIVNVMLQKSFRQHHLKVVILLLILLVIMYISTTSFLSYFLYSNTSIWEFWKFLSVLALNILSYYYVLLLERCTIRKISKTILKFGMFTMILLLAVAISINNIDIVYNVDFVLVIFNILNAILLYYLFPKNRFCLTKKYTLENKLCIRTAPLFYIIFIATVINSMVLLYINGLISINRLGAIFFISLLSLSITMTFFILAYLSASKTDYENIPNILNRNNNILKLLNEQQTILYSKETVSDIVISMFESAEELAVQKISGYYISKDDNGAEKIIKGYGDFSNLTNMYYEGIPEKFRYEKNSNWTIFGNNENSKSKLCVLPSDDISKFDLLIVNTFFSIAYEVISNFILLQNVFIEEKELIFSLTEISEIRSKETGQHIKRVGSYCRILASKYGLSAEDIEILVMSSQMHDLGKLCIPDEILHKPDKLTDEEIGVIKTHTTAGYNILDNCTGKYLRASKIIAKQHHEKYNGKGYHGMKGEDIDLFSRIVAIADVFDALTTKRSYKEAWEIDRVIKLFKEERGQHFDPALTDIFLDSIDEFKEIMAD